MVKNVNEYYLQFIISKSTAKTSDNVDFVLLYYFTIFWAVYLFGSYKILGSRFNIN